MPRLPNNSNFSMQGKNFFLTYSKCPLSHDRFIDFFKSSSHIPSYIHIALEKHADGSPHCHLFLQFDNNLHFTDSRKWDISDGNHTYHPDIQNGRDPQAILDYIDNKDGNAYKQGVFKRPHSRNRGSRDEIYAEILAKSSSNKEFMHNCKLMIPSDYARKRGALEYFASEHWPEKPELYNPKYTYFPNVPSTLTDWANENICLPDWRRPDRPLSLVIEGGKGIGKTEWARYLGPHNYFSGRVDFRKYSDSARYNVIDNIDFRHCLNMKFLLGAKHDVTVNIKYGRPKRIKGGIPTIVLCNPDMSWEREFSSEFKQWFDVNAIYIHVTDPFY